MYPSSQLSAEATVHLLLYKVIVRSKEVPSPFYLEAEMRGKGCIWERSYGGLDEFLTLQLAFEGALARGAWRAQSRCPQGGPSTGGDSLSFALLYLSVGTIGPSFRIRSLESLHLSKFMIIDRLVD